MIALLNCIHTAGERTSSLSPTSYFLPAGMQHPPFCISAEMKYYYLCKYWFPLCVGGIMFLFPSKVEWQSMPTVILLLTARRARRSSYPHGHHMLCWGWLNWQHLTSNSYCNLVPSELSCLSSAHRAIKKARCIFYCFSSITLLPFKHTTFFLSLVLSLPLSLHKSISITVSLTQPLLSHSFPLLSHPCDFLGLLTEDTIYRAQRLLDT